MDAKRRRPKTVPFVLGLLFLGQPLVLMTNSCVNRNVDIFCTICVQSVSRRLYVSLGIYREDYLEKNIRKEFNYINL